MARLYVFGIGGTGSRVLRSLTMLLATGVKTNGYDIVPIIIDPDSANADLTRTVALMNKYISIRSKLTFTAQDGKSFFKTSIKQTLPNFLIPVQNTNQTYDQFIGLNNMSLSDRAMAEMLFSEKNLSSDMVVGFKGNPNIGSVVLEQMASSEEFNEFANSFTQGDKIFIISSIFGGTGASGFPLLLKTLRHSNTLPNSGTLNTAEIGAITVLPYFKLKTNDQSAIDSSTFLSKARAALKYYQDNVSDANALYYIGDMPSSAYENNEGGTAQQNDANLIELLAATAIIDFCGNTFSQGQTSYRELGMDGGQGASSLKLFPLGNGMFNDFAYPMLEFALFAKSLVEDYNFVSSDNLKANKKINMNVYESQFGRDLRSYLEDYTAWLSELKGNSPSFAPFSISENKLGDLKDFVTDIPAKKFIFSNVDNNSFRSELNSVSPKNGTDEDKLLELYNKAARKFAKDKYKI